jgi:hypothetical protein
LDLSFFYILLKIHRFPALQDYVKWFALKEHGIRRISL